MTHEVSLATIRRGAAVEAFDEALRRVFENIADPNTEPDEVRQVTLTLKVKPNKRREEASVDVRVKTKLAAPASFGAHLFIVHTKDGITGVENNPNQPSLYEESDEQPVGARADNVTEASAAFGGEA